MTTRFSCEACTMQFRLSYIRISGPTVALPSLSFGNKVCNAPQVPKSDHPIWAGNT